MFKKINPERSYLGTENGEILKFSARGGSLVCLVSLLFGLSGWSNEIDKTDPRTRQTAFNISRRVAVKYQNLRGGEKRGHSEFQTTKQVAGTFHGAWRAGNFPPLLSDSPSSIQP